MQHFLSAFGVLLLCCTLSAQNPNCRPVIIVHNGLSATVLPINSDADPETDEVGVWVKATDFVRSCYGPCGATTFRYRIRKVGSGTGIPADSTLLFRCTELEEQGVEVWAIDAQGNAAYVVSYIVVQDELGQCNTPPQPILPNCNQDVMRPTLVLLHGLSANILPSPTGAAVRVLPSDFVASRTDNCAGPIPLRIRKSGNGGPTQTSLDYTCQELGQQEVEIWAGDLKGNWTHAISYVVIQDNGSDCNGQTVASGCSPDLIPVAAEVLSGLSVPVGANGRVSLRAEEWVRKRSDNCSAPVALRIRKPGEAGPPTSIKVEFSCQELGLRDVEIWSRDMAGNWSYVQTYVFVQDNIGVCGQMKGQQAGLPASIHGWGEPLQLNHKPANVDIPQVSPHSSQKDD